MKINLKVIYLDDDGNPLETFHTENLTTVNRFVSELEMLINLVATKNAHYGDAWKKQGWMGSMARIMSKTDRLHNMLWQTHHSADLEEPVQETFQDLAALALFGRMNYEDGNRWGKR